MMNSLNYTKKLYLVGLAVVNPCSAEPLVLQGRLETQNIWESRPHFNRILLLLFVV